MKIRIEDTVYEGTGTEIMETPRSFRTQKAIFGSFAATSSA